MCKYNDLPSLVNLQGMHKNDGGGNLLGKFVSYLHNYLEAPADAESEIWGFNLFQKAGVCSGIVHRDSAG